MEEKNKDFILVIVVRCFSIMRSQLLDVTKNVLFRNDASQTSRKSLIEKIKREDFPKRKLTRYVSRMLDEDLIYGIDRSLFPWEFDQ